ncbi:hypothetical protein [Rhodomicrobium lacus]|uniref:hypothetical protein n=1 Tax=Rhodomicrobium lacus TaxID=2498452 RepID=UPI000F8E86C3|nr:hypothetical protein [Rhodomicrobium lacus]
MNWSFEFFPFFPREVLIALAVASLVVLALSAWRNRRGLFLRALALACLLLALANPNLKNEVRQSLSNIAVVVVDESSSMQLAGRADRARDIEAALKEKFSQIPDLEVRWVHAAPTDQQGGESTELFAALDKAMGDIPPGRVAGAVFVTDGQIHDVPADKTRLGFDAPVHALIAGAPDEKDNRIEVVSAPRFGLVGSEQTAEIRAEKSGKDGDGMATISIRRASGPVETITAPYGKTVPIRMRFDRAGPNIVEIDLKAEPGELTTINNKTVIQAHGVRENLRVLLVSGEPHAGERTWRNLLRSDAAVDLVHFTILRPPEKHDGTPIDQLSLIAFPTRELFSEKLNQFDLIIFDRYQRRAVLPMVYLDNVARYVEQGGAVLVAAGADYASPVSLARTPLGQVLPARPTGRVVEEPFRPSITKEGEKHPVTAGLPGSPKKDGQEPKWGHWFRVVDSQADRGEVVMSGAEGKPLLVLDRRGEGRVALLLSDHAWLWARGYEGGGPHVDLLRRLAHWLMKEPDLEEEALSARAGRSEITVERRSVKSEIGEATLTLPSGKEVKVALDETAPGRFSKTIPTNEAGVHRVAMDGLTAVAIAGDLNSPEFRKVIATSEPIRPILEKSGGGAFYLGGTMNAPAKDVPSISMVKSGHRFAGGTWLGLKAQDAFEVKAVSYTPLVAGFAALGLALGLLALTWYREGR